MENYSSQILMIVECLFLTFSWLLSQISLVMSFRSLKLERLISVIQILTYLHRFCGHSQMILPPVKRNMVKKFKDYLKHKSARNVDKF